jgi:prepilin-type N-terminal cleavage/methylation domain-containing protein
VWRGQNRKSRMNMNRLDKDQRGFSLIELIIVIALTGIITTAITMTIFQVFNMNTRTSNRMTAVSQVQNAGKIVSEDILEAQTDKINANRVGNRLLVVGWTAPTPDGTTYNVTYALQNMPSGQMAVLQRQYSVNSTLNSTTIVAEYINPDQTSCAWNAATKTLTFTVTATVGKESEKRVYEVKPRPGS